MTHTPTVTEERSGFSITCPECGEIGSANELHMAQLLGRFHEAAFELADVAKEQRPEPKRPSAACVRSLSRRTRSRLGHREGQAPNHTGIQA